MRRVEGDREVHEVEESTEVKEIRDANDDTISGAINDAPEDPTPETVAGPTTNTAKPTSKVRNWLRARLRRPRAQSTSVANKSEADEKPANDPGGFIGGHRLTSKHPDGTGSLTNLSQARSASVAEVALAGTKSNTAAPPAGHDEPAEASRAQALDAEQDRAREQALQHERGEEHERAQEHERAREFARAQEQEKTRGYEQEREREQEVERAQQQEQEHAQLYEPEPEHERSREPEVGRTHGTLHEDPHEDREEAETTAERDSICLDDEKRSAFSFDGIPGPAAVEAVRRMDGDFSPAAREEAAAEEAAREAATREAGEAEHRDSKFVEIIE